jgi:hypothetical protein
MVNIPMFLYVEMYVKTWSTIYEKTLSTIIKNHGRQLSKTMYNINSENDQSCEDIGKPIGAPLGRVFMYIYMATSD